MKKALLVTFLAAVVFVFNGFADDPNPFEYDRTVIENAMTDLDQLEKYVVDEGVTLSEMNAEGTFENTSLIRVSPLDGTGLYGEPPLGIPAFWWGCIFGVVGLAIVYFIAEDAEQTKKALTGCIVGTLASIAIWAIYVVAVGASFWSIY